MYTKVYQKNQLANELNIAAATLSRVLKRLKESYIINSQNKVINFNKLEKIIFESE